MCGPWYIKARLYNGLYDHDGKSKLFVVVLKGHIRRWSEKLVVVESRADMILFNYRGNGAHFQTVIHIFTLWAVHVKGTRNSYVTNGEKKNS